MRRTATIAALSLTLALCRGTALAAPGAPENGAAPVTIFTPAGTDSAQNPAFSPDGERILSTIWHDGYNIGAAGLHIVPFSGGAATPLVEDGESQIVNLPGTSWNPTLDRITYSSDADGIDDIWTIAADGSDPVNLTQLTAGTIHYQEPSFSPEGSQIVFEIVDDVTERGEIWRIDNLPGTIGLTAVIDHDESSPLSDRQPNWSPTGDRIVFQRHTIGQDFVNLFVVDPDGSDLVQLTFYDAEQPGEASDASFSPDGRYVVYSSAGGSLAHANLFAVPVQGGPPIRVTHDDTRYDGAPSWSPDGDWIAYESSLGDPDGSVTQLRRIASPIEVPEATSALLEVSAALALARVAQRRARTRQVRNLPR